MVAPAFAWDTCTNALLAAWPILSTPIASLRHSRVSWFQLILHRSAQYSAALSKLHISLDVDHHFWSQFCLRETEMI